MPDRPAAVRPPHATRLIVIVGCLSAFGPLSIDMYLPGFPRIEHGFHTSESLVQLTLTACIVGLALGQIVAGPLSDARGRRRPLMAGLALYAAASLLCAIAPSVWLLVVLRLGQGLAGAVGLVIANALVRDAWGGVGAARVFSLTLLVRSAAPIVAPVIGGVVLSFTSWRGIFVVLAAMGLVLLGAVAVLLPETHPHERRRPGGVLDTTRTFRRLLRTRSFMGYATSQGFVFGTMFAYIAGSPFVLEKIYGLSPGAFSAVFAANAGGIMATGQLNGFLVGRVGSRRLLRVGLALSAVGTLGLFAVVVTGAPGLGLFLPPLFVTAAAMGLIIPNAAALALEDEGTVAGSASALIGVLQYAPAAVVAPLVGIVGVSAYPMMIIMAILSCTAGIVFVTLAPWKHRRTPELARA